MSKDKIVVEAVIKTRGDWQTEGQLEANYEYAGRAEDGTILVRRKGDKTGVVQKVADTLVAILFGG